MTTATEATKTHFEILTHPAWQAFFQKYYLKVIETWTGGEGYGMNAELYRKSDKKKIAHIRDDGNGGGFFITHFTPDNEPTMRGTDAYKAFLAEVATLPPSEFYGTTLETSDEIAISTLATIAEYAAMVKKARGKKRYLAITPDMEEGEALQFDVAKTATIEQAKAGILKHRPNAFVINELL